MKRMALVLLLTLVAGTARADEVLQPIPPPPPRLEVNPWVTGGVIVVGGSLWLASSVFQNDLAAKSCRLWCERDQVNGFDTSVRDALVWQDRQTANTLSNITAYALGPTLALGGLALVGAYDRPGADWGERWLDDSLIVLESTVIAGVVNRVVVLSFGRTRPRARYGESAPDDIGNNQSFYSGHTTAAFVVGVSAATVASLRHYRFAPWLWASALTVGAVTGWMRMAGDDHWMTDVLTAAVVSTAIGIGVPLLHRAGPDGEALMLGGMSLPGGGVLTLAGRF